MDKVKPKIFQIGFNKSGTGSIYSFFKMNGIKSIHWDDGLLSKKMKENSLGKKPLLTGYEEYQFFSDMEHKNDDEEFFYSYQKFFKDLDNQYPESIFILNYRDIDSWVKSRIKHPRYLERTISSSGKSEEEVIEMWKEHYNEHISEVLDYFSGKDNLIVLDLDKDDSVKIYHELSVRGVYLNIKELPHTHKTKDRNKKKNQESSHIDNIRDAALFFENKNSSIAYELMKIAEKMRPNGPFISKKIKQMEGDISDRSFK